MQGPERRWERTHSNGWLTMATEEPDGSFRYSARQERTSQANWSGRTSELLRAQLLADDQAHAVNCRCPGWREIGE